MKRMLAGRVRKGCRWLMSRLRRATLGSCNAWVEGRPAVFRVPHAFAGNRFRAPRILGFADDRLVERIGIEPMTPCLQSRCSPS